MSNVLRAMFAGHDDVYRQVERGAIAWDAVDLTPLYVDGLRDLVQEEERNNPSPEPPTTRREWRELEREALDRRWADGLLITENEAYEKLRRY